jgi:hypothetical protein
MTPMCSRLSINNLGRPGSAWQTPSIHPLSVIWNRAKTSGECLCRKRTKSEQVLGPGKRVSFLGSRPTASLRL